MDEKPFTITSFAWRSDVERRLAAGGEISESQETILQRLSALAGFLERHGLTTRALTINGGVDTQFVLRSTDLTPLGLELIREAYEKWMRTAKSPEDVVPLERGLARLNAKRN
jgi:hypothetical protein